MRRSFIREILVGLAAFGLGALVALFGLGPALFADGEMTGRLIVLGVSFVLYFGLGVSAGLSTPDFWKVMAVLLVAPLVPVALLFGREPLSALPTAALLIAFLLGDTACAFSGALLGASRRRS